jgi:beta-mannanase
MVGFTEWASNGSPLLFTDMQPTLDALKNAGYGIVLTWCAEDRHGPYLDPRYNYASIISGQYDAYISQWAQSAAAWGKPFYLRLFHEMNGNWYPWGIHINGNTPALAIQAWQHVYKIFQSAGATNVKFLWEPTFHTPAYLIDPLASFYPGDAYVDWLGVDGYNWGQYGLEEFWNAFTSPTELFQYTYNEMMSTVSSAKPVMLVETASAAGAASTDKAAWITQLQNDATLFPNLKAVGYYDGSSEDGLPDHAELPLSFWRFDEDPYSLAAFRALSGDIRWQGTLP